MNNSDESFSSKSLRVALEYGREVQEAAIVKTVGYLALASNVIFTALDAQQRMNEVISVPNAISVVGVVAGVEALRQAYASEHTARQSLEDSLVGTSPVQTGEQIEA